MQGKDKPPRRDRGDGSLTLRPNAKGGETWICFWRQDGRGVMRSLGPKRSKVQPQGLTKPQAEAAFRKLREETRARPGRAQRRTFAEVGAELICTKRAAGRKAATVESYDSCLRIHIVPFFGAQPVDKVNREDVQRFDAELEAKGLSPKSRANALGTLHSLIEFAIRRDVDWAAGRIRVRRNFVRGEFGTPKSKRSSRTVPMATRVAAELDRLFKDSRYEGDDDLVFAHPATGRPIDRSRLLKRFKAALRRAGLRQVRFHEYADVCVMPTWRRKSSQFGLIAA
jgi:Phage integrase, N-terminal SAM-like domain/Phage integrase family